MLEHMRSMKFRIVVTAVLTLLVQSFSIRAQTYCFWLANYSDQTFTTVRIRETGSSDFGEDLFESMLIEPYQHYWIRTGETYTSVFDIEIRNAEGNPLKFSWTGKNGVDYRKPYITLDLSPLNTLMISNDEQGDITWDFTNSDDYGFGDPCNP